MQNRNVSYTTLVFTFSFIAILIGIIWLGLFSTKKFDHLKAENISISSLQTQRSNLLNQLRKQSVQRALYVNAISAESDPFNKNDLFDLFHGTGTPSANALIAFGKLGLSETEHETLDRLKKAMRKAGISQNIVVDLFIEEKTKLANEHLINETFDLVRHSQGLMNELQSAVSNWHNQKIKKLNAMYQVVIKTTLQLGSLLILFSSIIIIIVLRYISKKENYFVKRALVTLESINQSIITTDINGQVDFLNPFAELFIKDLGLKDIIGKKFHLVCPIYNEENIEILASLIPSAIETKTAINLHAPAYIFDNDVKIWIDFVIAPIISDSGIVLGTSIIIADVSAIHTLNAKLKWQANHDSLTGLFNRRYLDDVVKSAIKRAKYSQASSTLCYLDLDNFKIINDQAGHPAGDQVLKDVSSILESHVREYDVVSRIGGDEFVILFYRCTAEQGEIISNKILLEIKNYSLIWARKTYAIGASFGICQIDKDIFTLEQLHAKTDSALYKAKEAGKGLVVVG